MDTYVLIFVEGDTECEFYKILLAALRTKSETKRWAAKSIKLYNLAGIGNYKTDALIKYERFQNSVKGRPEQKFKINVALCYDSDVFEYDKKPPVNMKRVETALKEKGATKVIHIKAVHSIEDWFLSDSQGIKSFFGKSAVIGKSNKSGYEILKTLFKTKNKVYYKGKKATALLEHLDMIKILEENYDSLKGLCTILGISSKKHTQCD